MKTLFPFLFIAVLISACQPQTGGQVQAAADVQPKGAIDVETARRMVGNFTGRSTHKIQKGGSFYRDSRCVWFSLQQLKSLIARIDAEKGDGIRFYYAAYDPVLQASGLKMSKGYLDYSTLVMVSTHDTLGHHFDYYNGSGKKGFIITAAPENQGELCPPPVNCNDLGATLLPPDSNNP